MYQLSIDHPGRSRSVTDHVDREHAHRSLLDYVIGADYYLRPLPTGSETTRYELLALAEPDSGASHPRRAGHATIQAATRPAASCTPSPDDAAAAAHRWLNDHQLTWDHGCDTDPGTRYPLAVLTTARAEGRYWFTAGTLWREAAQLAGTDLTATPDQHLLETLRHRAIAHAAHQLGPADLAAAVLAQLPEHTTAEHTNALIWWYALLRWGATAS